MKHASVGNLGTGCPDTAISESLNTFWQSILEVNKMQGRDSLDRFGEYFATTGLCKLVRSEMKHAFFSAISVFYDNSVRANEVSANRTEQNRTEQNRTEQNRTEQNRTEQRR